MLFELVRIVLVARLELAETAALLDDSPTTFMMFCLESEFVVPNYSNPASSPNKHRKHSPHQDR